MRVAGARRSTAINQHCLLIRISLGLASLLERWSNGEKDAYDQLLTHLYGDIHAIAVRQLHRERYLTMRPTALVHEVYLRLSQVRKMQWQDRAYFLSMATTIARK